MAYDTTLYDEKYVSSQGIFVHDLINFRNSNFFNKLINSEMFQPWRDNKQMDFHACILPWFWFSLYQLRFCSAICRFKLVEEYQICIAQFFWEEQIKRSEIWIRPNRSRSIRPSFLKFIYLFLSPQDSLKISFSNVNAYTMRKTQYSNLPLNLKESENSNWKMHIILVAEKKNPY